MFPMLNPVAKQKVCKAFVAAPPVSRKHSIHFPVFGKVNIQKCNASVHSPPPVADTKAKFTAAYSKPIGSIYNTVLQELLVQQHFIRYSVNYQYNQIMALGLVSVFDQVMDGLEPEERTKVFDAYLGAVNEDPEVYRKDSQILEAAASELSGPGDLKPLADGNAIQKALAQIAERTAAKKFAYNRFFAIGLFRLLELTGAKEPAALEKLVSATGARADLVNRDLMMYKNILSKLSASKDLMKEFLERERKKQAEREAAKAAKSAGQAAETPAVQQA